jgi:hypothetical protein
MSKTKSIAVLSAACLMVLAACTPTVNPGTSSKPASSRATSSAKASSSTSRAPVKALAITELTLNSDEGVANIVLKGSIANFTEAEAKFALGLKEIALDSADTAIAWLGAGETPADAAYTYAPVIAEGAFTVTIPVSDIEGLKDGYYQVYAGAKGFYAQVGAISNATRVKGGDFSFYVRQDEQVGLTATLVLDRLPPVSLEEASVFKHDDDHIYAKVGGLKKAEVDQEFLDELTPFINLQQVGGSWGNTRVNTFFFTIEGDKAYINFDINFVVAGTNYNTHLNLLENKQADAKMDNAINDNYVYNNKLINVYANPSASASDQSEFWGNLAFKVSEAPEGAVEGKQVAAE